MGLASALNTALTGLTAAQTTIDVVGNNVANANTVGFKASAAVFATQFLQTKSLGSAPTGARGGTNPRQTGLGTQVAEITPDFTQGTIQISSNPSDLAIQGDGFFIVQGGQGEQLFTRNGVFKTNAQNELVTTTGQRLLGFGVDDNFQIQSTGLEQLTIPLGSASVAQATQNVFLEGTLSPAGNLADTAEIIQSGVLGDAVFAAPASGTTITQSTPPNVSGTSTTGQAGAGSLTALGTYRYRVVFGDGTIGSTTDTESTSSVDLGPITLAAGENEIQLTNLPVDGTGTYKTRRIYRTVDGGSTFSLVSEIPDNVTTTFTDGVADGSLGAALNSNSLTGNYSYYVTFANAAGGPGTGIESRPTPLIGPLNLSNGRSQLANLPVDTSGQFSVRRIYRNLATDSSEFHFVAEIPDNLANQSFTDNVSDTTIQANATINLDGPPITSNTLLTNVLQRNGNTFDQVFSGTGTLAFTGRKGGRTLATKTLTTDASTTVLDLINFIEEATGIQEPPGPDPGNPIPGDAGSSSNPGGLVTANGQIRLVSNNGVDNALDIGLAGLQLTTGSSGPQQINLPFSSSQTAIGEGAVADFVVFDSLGLPLQVRLTTVLENRTSTQTVYRYFADSPDNDPLTGSSIAVGTGLITFDGAGNFVSATDSTVSIDRRNIPSASPLSFELDFSQLSGLADESGSSLAAARQDGSAPGTLSSFIIGEDGVLRGVFSNGITRDLGQIRLARFANPTGLEQRGQNLFASGVNSGLPIQGNPSEQGIGTISAGAVELSNTDIGTNLIDLILASTQYRGNTRVITAAQQLLDELLNLRR